MATDEKLLGYLKRVTAEPHAQALRAGECLLALAGGVSNAG